MIDQQIVKNMESMLLQLAKAIEDIKAMDESEYVTISPVVTISD